MIHLPDPESCLAILHQIIAVSIRLDLRTGPAAARRFATLARVIADPATIRRAFHAAGAALPRLLRLIDPP